jgi:release factor glutamine methyltransferase
MTVEEAYKTIVELLGSLEDGNEARAISRRLLEEITGVRHAHLMQPARLLEPLQVTKFDDYIKQLQEGKPLPYLLGECEFYGLPFRCDERGLIPRPETELLVELALERLKPFEAPLVADLGTGSGCIAVSIAQELAGAVVYATDASGPALELASSNARLNAIENRINFVSGNKENWVSPLISQGLAGKLHAIFSNPPYIAKAEIETLQPQVRDWEPRAALDGGDDGLDCYRAIARQCGVLLAPQGFLAVELGAGQFAEVSAIFETFGWVVEAPRLDFAGIERVLIAALNR